MHSRGAPIRTRRSSSASNRDGATTMSPSRNPYSSSSRISYTETRSRSSSLDAASGPKSTQRSSAATHLMVLNEASGNAESGGSHRTVATRSNWSTVSTTPNGESVAEPGDSEFIPTTTDPTASSPENVLCPCRGSGAAFTVCGPPSAAAMSATPAAPLAATPPLASGGFRSSARRATNCPGQKSCSPRCSCGTRSFAATRRVTLPSCQRTSTYVCVPTTVAAGRSRGIGLFATGSNGAPFDFSTFLNKRLKPRLTSSATPTDSQTDAATPAPALAVRCERTIPSPSTPPPSYRSFDEEETSGKSLSYPSGSEASEASESPATAPEVSSLILLRDECDFGGGVSGTTVLSPSWKQVCAKCVSGRNAEAGICSGGAAAPPSDSGPGVRGARGNAPATE